MLGTGPVLVKGISDFLGLFKILFFEVQGGLQKVLYSYYYLLLAETLITNVLFIVV